MADATWQFCVRFRLWRLCLYGMVEIYLQTKFRRHISTSGFWKQTSAMSEFYFRFRFLRLRHHRHVIMHLPTKYRQNWTIRNRVMTSYPFLKMAGFQPYSIFSRLTADHPWSANEGLKSPLNRILASEILLFLRCEVLAWNCLLTWLYPPRMRRIEG